MTGKNVLYQGELQGIIDGVIGWDVMLHKCEWWAMKRA